MTIPTEPIGSIPRPLRLLEAVVAGDGVGPRLDPLYEEAIRDTVARFAATGSPVITDGEQRKYHNFWTYCVHGLPGPGLGKVALTQSVRQPPHAEREGYFPFGGELGGR